MNYGIPSRETTDSLLVSQKEKRERDRHFLKEIISKKFPNLGGNLDIQVPEFIGLQRVSTLKVLLQDTL